MAPDRSTLFYTMSNPNTNAVMSMLRNALQPKETTTTGFKIVHVGTDKIPVSILEMVSLNGKIW